MKLIAGLGNPGEKYLLTPHNIGWIVIDALAQHWGLSWRTEKKFSSQIAKKEDLLLLKPLTYMNLSGSAVQSATQYYRVELDDLLVIHDDTDLDFLSLRFQKNRGPAGHNGVKSIHQELGSQDYTRMRIGMPQGRVLKPFTKKEQSALPDFLNQAVEAVTHYLKEGLEKTANRYNVSAEKVSKENVSAKNVSTKNVSAEKVSKENTSKKE